MFYGIYVDFNGKEYYISTGSFHNSFRYYFYNKTTMKFMGDLDQYSKYQLLRDSVQDALSKENEIVIKMIVRSKLSELLKTNINHSDLNSSSILSNHELRIAMGQISDNERPITAKSSNNNSAHQNSASHNSSNKNNVSGFKYERIDTLDKLKELLELVKHFDIRTNDKHIGRKEGLSFDLKENIIAVITSNIMMMSPNNIDEQKYYAKQKEYIINTHGEFEPFVIKDDEDKIISVGAIHKEPLFKSKRNGNRRPFMKLHLILAVPGSNKGTGKKSIQKLFDCLPEEYAGIMVKPLKGAEEFYKKIGFAYYRDDYYIKEK